MVRIMFSQKSNQNWPKVSYLFSSFSFLASSHGCLRQACKLRTAKHTLNNLQHRGPVSQRFDLFKGMLLLGKLLIIEATQTEDSKPVVVIAQNDH